MDISYQWIRSRRKTIAIQIDRNGQVILPRGKDVMKEGDTVVVITARKGLNDIMDIFLTK